MKYLERFSKFDSNMITESFSSLTHDVYFNKTLNCMKIDSLYFFLSEEKVLDTNGILNENMFTDAISGLGSMISDISWSSLIPDTTSEWIHLGVDVISGIIDFIPTIGNAISVVIDLLHAIAYFIEAEFNPEEKTQLYLSGGITAFFALVPFAGNFGSVALKKSLGASSKLGGNIFKSIIGNSILLPVKLIKKFTKFIFRLPLIQKKALQIILKNQDKWWFKGLIKLPIIKKMVNFIKNGLDDALINASKWLTKDFNMYQKAVIGSLENNARNIYKKSDNLVKKIINEEDFVKLYMNKVSSKYGDDIFESLSMNGQVLNKANQKVVDFYSNNGYKNIIKNKDFFGNSITKEIMEAKTLSKSFIKDNVPVAVRPYISKFFETEVAKHIAKNGNKQIPYDTLLKKSFRKLPKHIIKKIPKLVLTKIPSVIIKQLVNDDKIDIKEIKDDNTSLEDLPNGDDVASIESKSRSKYDKFAESNYLEIGQVDNVDEIGTMYIDFKTPNKQGEDGKLIQGGGVFMKRDITNTMDLYTDRNDLLNDLILVGKKRDNKKRIRNGEYKKWELSSKFTTPYIGSEDNIRYEFYYLIRERSKISLIVKKDTDKVNWKELVNDVVNNKGTYKFNPSLYLIVKKIKDNGDK